MSVTTNSQFCTIAEGRLKILISSDFVMTVVFAQLKMTSNCLRCIVIIESKCRCFLFLHCHRSHSSELHCVTSYCGTKPAHLSIARDSLIHSYLYITLHVIIKE